MNEFYTSAQACVLYAFPAFPEIGPLVRELEQTCWETFPICFRSFVFRDNADNQFSKKSRYEDAQLVEAWKMGTTRAHESTNASVLELPSRKLK